MLTSRKRLLRKFAIAFLSTGGVAGLGCGKDLLDPPSSAGDMTRVLPTSRVVEQWDANRIRVLAYNHGGVELGQCSSGRGDILNCQCAPNRGKYESKPLRSIEDAAGRGGGRFVSLNEGTFRQYSSRVDASGRVVVGAGPVSAESSASTAHYRMGMEWRRFVLWKLESPPSANMRKRPFVSAVEYGIAARMDLDVRITSVEGGASAEFSLADLETKLARSEATAVVRYDIVGASKPILPKAPVAVNSVSAYIRALTDFHDAVRDISDAWKDAEKLPVEDGGTNDFYIGLIAYYVTGPRVGDGFTETAWVDPTNTCEGFEYPKTATLALRTLSCDFKDKISNKKLEIGIIVNGSPVWSGVVRPGRLKSVGRSLQILQQAELALVEYDLISDDDLGAIKIDVTEPIDDQAEFKTGRGKCTVAYSLEAVTGGPAPAALVLPGEGGVPPSPESDGGDAGAALPARVDAGAGG